MALVTARPLLWSPDTVAGVSLVTPGGAWANSPWVEVLAVSPTGCAIAYLMGKCITSGLINTDGVVDIGWGTSSASVCLAASFPFTIGQSLVGSTWDLQLPVPITVIPSGFKIFARYRNSLGGVTTMDNLSIGYYDSYDSTHGIALTMYREPNASDAPVVTSPASLWTFSAWTTLTSGYTTPVYVAGLSLQPDDSSVLFPESEFELSVGAGHTSIGTIPSELNGEGTFMVGWLPRVVPVAPNTSISVRVRMNTATATGVQLSLYYYGAPGSGCVALTLTCVSSTANVGTPYSEFLDAAGGTPPYVSYAIISGSLPPGLTLNTATGEISGTPTTAGIYAYTAQVTDTAADTADASCFINVGQPLPPTDLLAHTWVFDATENQWHERAGYDENTDAFTRWRARGCAAIGAKILVGDYATGDLYLLDMDTFTDNGERIKRQRTAPYLSGENQILALDQVELGIQAGVGNGADPNPVVTLEVSSTSGATFKTPADASMGAAGSPNARARWRRRGQSRADRLVIRVTSTAKVRQVWGPGLWIRSTSGTGEM